MVDLEDSTENPRSVGMTAEAMPEMDETGEEAATEDEQLDYDMLVVRAQKMMYGQGRESILELLGSSETPAQGLGQAASMLVKSLMQSAKQSGREISGEVAINAGAEIIELLSELATKNNVFQYESDEEESSEIQDAVLWGVKYYGDGMIADGEITPEMQGMAQTQMQEGIQEDLEANAPGGEQKTAIAAGVEEAMIPNKSSGIIDGLMKGSV